MTASVEAPVLVDLCYVTAHTEDGDLLICGRSAGHEDGSRSDLPVLVRRSQKIHFDAGAELAWVDPAS